MTVADTNQHYDLDPEVFSLYLDPMRKYSSGLYHGTDDTLAQAQQAKLHFVAGRLGLREGQRLLDIGCGWGALILFMAEHYGARVTGISPAPQQHEYIRGLARERGLEELVSTEIGHFEHSDQAPRSFDAITMLGSIVHMPDLDAVFARCHGALRTGGMLYVSESCYRNAAKRAAFSERESAAFVRDDIFGWGDMRPLSDLVRGAEDAGFSVVAVDDLTEHYHRTIEDWLAGVTRNAARLDEIRPGLPDELTRYLRTANAGWGFTTKHYALTCAKRR